MVTFTPFTRDDIFAQGDVLDASRQALIFPPIDGISDMEMAIRAVNFTLPRASIAQRQVVLFGHPRRFSGGRMADTSFNVSFYETTGAVVSTALWTWMNEARHYKDDIAALRAAGYAKDITAVQWDSVGNVAIQYILRGCWPMTATAPPHSEPSSPYRIDASFSVDFVDYGDGSND